MSAYLEKVKRYRKEGRFVPIIEEFDFSKLQEAKLRFIKAWVGDVPKFLVINNEGWMNIAGTNKFVTCFESTTQYEEISKGNVGKLFGFQVLTDSYAKPTEKFVDFCYIC